MKVTQTAANIIDDNNTSQPIAASESRLTTQSDKQIKLFTSRQYNRNPVTSDIIMSQRQKYHTSSYNEGSLIETNLVSRCPADSLWLAGHVENNRRTVNNHEVAVGKF